MKIELESFALPPERAHSTDAGMDLKSPICTTVPARGSVVIDLGVHMELPYGTVGILKSKSGLNVKHGITSTGTIDEGYTGSVKVKLYNHSDTDYIIHRGDKVTQLVVVECLYPTIEIVDHIKRDTERGEGGFGSTGR